MTTAAALSALYSAHVWGAMTDQPRTLNADNAALRLLGAFGYAVRDGDGWVITDAGLEAYGEALVADDG